MFAVAIIPLVVVFSLGGLAIQSFFLAYLGHASLAIIEQTAAGNDEITWPNEPWPDWFWHGLYPVRLLLVWLAVFSIPYAIIGRETLSEHIEIVLVLGAVFFWLVFPLSLLSSLSMASVFVVLRPAVVVRLLKLPRPLLSFYATSALLVLGVLGLLLFGLVGWRELVPSATTVAPTWLPLTIAIWAWVFVVPLAAVCGATAIMYYARLLGRLAWMMNLGQPKRKKRRAASQMPAVSSPQPTTPAPSPDPVPGVETFALAPEGPPEKPVIVGLPMEDHDEDESDDEDEEDETEEQTAPAKLPPLLTRSVWLFPWYRSSVKTWIWFSLNVLVVLGVLLLFGGLLPI